MSRYTESGQNGKTVKPGVNLIQHIHVLIDATARIRAEVCVVMLGEETNNFFVFQLKSTLLTK